MANVEYDFDLTMQKKILALLIQDFQYLSSVGIEVVKPSYFDNLVYQNLCKWIVTYFKQYHTPVTESVLTTELNRYDEKVNMSSDEKEMYFSTIRDMINIVIEDVDYVKDAATQFARKAAFRGAILQIKDLYDNGLEPEDGMQILQNAASVGAGEHLGMDLTECIDKMPDILNEIYDRKNLFQTMIPSLDDALMGGMAKGELHVVVGAPGKGKSKLMSYMAYAGLLQNRHVVYISCELKEPAVMSNIVQCATGFTMMDIMDPAKREIYLAKAEKIKRLAPHLKAIYYPNKTVNINNIRTYLTKLQTIEEFRPGLIIVDYADLLNPVAKPLGNNYEDCGNIFYDLVTLADLYECPVVTGSQLGRHVWNQVGDEVITQDTLADSAKKAHVS